MSTNADELLEPSDAELLQEEEELKAVPVEINTPVNTRELPSKFGSMFTEKAVGTAVAVRILGRDPRRKSAKIIGLSQNLRFGPTQAVAQTTGAEWPAIVPMVTDCFDELWVCATTSTTDISVIAEWWAE